MFLNNLKLDNGIYDFNYNELQIWAPKEAPISGYRSWYYKIDENRKLLMVDYILNIEKINCGWNDIKINMINNSIYGYCEHNVSIEKIEIELLKN